MAAIATAASERIARNEKPTVVSVYRTTDGGIHHARCSRRMAYRGDRPGGLELDFYCLACHEHVTLPEFLAARLPVSIDGGRR